MTKDFLKKIYIYPYRQYSSAQIVAWQGEILYNNIFRVA